MYWGKHFAIGLFLCEDDDAILPERIPSSIDIPGIDIFYYLAMICMLFRNPSNNPHEKLFIMKSLCKRFIERN